jgi:hypothetical protein
LGREERKGADPGAGMTEFAWLLLFASICIDTFLGFPSQLL